VASTIKIKRSGVLNKTPTTVDIDTGELAINYKDQKLFSSNGTAVFSFTNDYIQVANAASTYLTKNNPVITGTLTANGSVGTAGYYLRTSGSGIYWSPVSANGGGGGGGATWAALTGTNTALRLLIADRLQVANAVATYQTKVVERAALANTNAYIATRATWSSVTGTNTALRTLISDRLQVANASSLYATKSNPTTSGLLAHTGRATISTNLTVSGNASVTGTMTATGIVSGSELTSTLASGDEGGQVNLAKPPNATTSGGVTIDAYQNKLRIFEQGGTSRGVYIDLTAAAAGVGTNLLTGGSSTTQYLQVANAVATYATKAYAAANSYVKSVLANTNAYIGAQATRINLINTNLTGTNTALRTLISDRLQVANAAAVYQTKAVERAALANTNSYIATQATRINLINTNLTGTNTALRTLISDRLQVANAAAVYQTKAIERAALANTNSSIATQTSRITLVNTNLTGTNTALRTLINDRLQVANASTLYATKSNPTTSGLLAHTGRATISTNLTVSGNTTLGAVGKVFNTTGLHNHIGRQTISTNLYVAGNTVLGNANTVTDRTIINGVLVANGNFSVAGNTTIGGASKTITMGGAASTLTIGGAGHTTNTTGWFGVAGRATISTNLSVSGNTILSGTLVANSSAGVAGYYLRTSGTGVYWSPVSGGGGGANGFSGILVGANVVSADSTTDRLTLVAGSGISLAANPTTDTITIATNFATANVVTKTLNALLGTDTVVTSVSGVVFGSGVTGGGTDKAFYENDTTITTNYTITAGKNAMTAGPVTINSGVTVTVPSGSVWSII